MRSECCCRMAASPPGRPCRAPVLSRSSTPPREACSHLQAQGQACPQLRHCGRAPLPFGDGGQLPGAQRLLLAGSCARRLGGSCCAVALQPAHQHCGFSAGGPCAQRPSRGKRGSETCSCLEGSCGGPLVSKDAELGIQRSCSGNEVWGILEEGEVLFSLQGT